MQFSKDINNIFNKLAQDSIINREIFNLLEDISSHKEFLYIDITDKDDYISFIPNKKSIIENAVYKVNNLTIVELSHEIYSIALNSILDKSRINNNIYIDRSESSYKIIGTYPACERYKDQYDIIHLLDIDNNSEVLICEYKTNKSVSINFERLEIKKSEVKIGRFLSKIIDKSKSGINDSQIEYFVNSFKSYNIFMRNIQDNLKVVKGRSIKAWYNKKRYSKENIGILSKSCMRHDSCNNFFNMYVHKDNGVKMLILRDADDKLIGRALLWENTSIGKYMDRIYGLEHIIKVFLKWGELNDYKCYNSNLSDNEITVKIKADLSDQFPFMDTFRYMYTESDLSGLQDVTLSTVCADITTEEYNSNKVKYYILSSTSGLYSKSNNYNN